MEAEAVHQAFFPAATTDASDRVLYAGSNKTVVSHLKRIDGRMESVYSGRFEKLPVKEWLARAKELRIEALIASYLDAMIEKGEMVAFPYLGAQRVV